MDQPSSATLAEVEFLYGIESEGYDNNDDWHPARIVQFRITRKTPRRIYYLADDVDRSERSRAERFADRLILERDGQVTRRSAGWWESDLTVYLAPPVIEETQQPDLVELKAAMAAAHPDRGGTDETFIAARQQYERARIAAST